MERGRTSVGGQPREGQRYQRLARVGDIVRPTDGGDYRGIVLEATHRSVTHRSLETGYECITSREYFHERYRLVAP